MEKDLANDLDKLLSEDISGLKIRETTTFDRLVAPLEASLVLFGAGNLGRRTLKGLRQVGVEPLAFADNNPDLWNKPVDGLMAFSPAEAAAKFGNQAAFVITIWGSGSSHRIPRTQQQLHDLQCARVVSFAPLFWKYPQVFLPYFCLDLPHKFSQQGDQIRAGFKLWADEPSRSEYLAQLRFRFWLDFDGLPGAVTGEQYFPDDLFECSPDEVFVDCGAFDGDTLRVLLGRQGTSFQQIIALEPDPLNFQNLQRFISSLDDTVREKIITQTVAVGGTRGKVRFAGDGLSSSAISANGTIEVDVAPLDEILQGISPTYIKMDVEGAEPEALEGAAGIIRKDLPFMAISVYHRFDHLWRLPLLIQSMSRRYCFFLRSHGAEAFDLVCYAVPADRLRLLL